MTKKSIKHYRILRKRSRRREKAMIKTCALVMAFLLWNDSNFKDLEDLRGIAFRYHSVEYDFQGIALGIGGAVFNIGVNIYLVADG